MRLQRIGKPAPVPVDSARPVPANHRTDQIPEAHVPATYRFADIAVDRPDSAESGGPGLPETLRSRILAASGVDLSDVRVHANSYKPARLNAFAYAQGNEIHLGPGRQRHLPHEAWHLVQQRLGRVRPTRAVDGIAIDGDPRLETEAEAAGERLVRGAPPGPVNTSRGCSQGCGCAACAGLRIAPPVSNAAPAQLCGKCDDDNCLHGEVCGAPSLKRPRDSVETRQTHLGARAFTAKGRPTLAVAERHDRRFGEETSAAHSDSKSFTDNYREPQIQYSAGRGGMGLDERFSTASTSKVRQKLLSRYPDNEVDTAIGSLSEARDLTGDLLWAKSDDDSQPLNAHPGGLSKDPADSRYGITHGHTQRDAKRARWAMHQFGESFDNNEELSEVLEKSKLMANIKTLDTMSQPFSALNQVVPSGKAVNTYHPRFGPVIENGQRTSNFDTAISSAHNNREFTKMQTAAGLVRMGMKDLVDPGVVAHLKEHGNDPDRAHDARYRDQDSDLVDTGPAVTQVALPPESMSLDKMRRSNQTIPGMYRSISALRP